jgi:hypothetical protein
MFRERIFNAATRFATLRTLFATPSGPARPSSAPAPWLVADHGRARPVTRVTPSAIASGPSGDGVRASWFMLRVNWIVAAALACGGSSPPTRPAGPAPAAVSVDAGPALDAGPLDQDLSRLAKRSLAMYLDVAKALADSAEDCKAATAKLGELSATYHDVVTANAKVLQDGRAKQLRAALDPYNDEFDRAAKAVVQSPTMSKCSQDGAFARAFDQLLEAPP